MSLLVYLFDARFGVLTQWTISISLHICVCVCVCVCARARLCAHVCKYKTSFQMGLYNIHFTLPGKNVLDVVVLISAEITPVVLCVCVMLSSNV